MLMGVSMVASLLLGSGYRLLIVCSFLLGNEVASALLSLQCRHLLTSSSSNASVACEVAGHS